MIPDDDYRLKTTGTFDNIDLYNSKLKAGSTTSMCAIPCR